MSNSISSWLHRPRYQRRPKHGKFFESLEQRLLLATITGLSPAANSFDAARDADVVATFDEAITPASASADNFVVQSSLSHNTFSVTASEMTVTADPANSFFAGERIQVTATAGIQGAATANTPRTWQFRVGASAGSGQFVDTGQVIGPNDTGRSDRVSFADIDGDGDLDAFAGTRFWVNDGTGVFAESGQSITVGGEEIVFGDVDSDGDLDLIGQSDVFLNDGSGVFSAGANLNGDRGSYNTAAAAGDLDGDGDLDVMQGNTYGGNRVFFNNGSGGFTDSGQSLTTLGGTDSIELADFDGDGDLDALEVVNGGANRIWLNDGAGVFAALSTIGGFDGTKDADAGDVDGDGDVDLLLVNNNEGSDQNVRIWLNDGSANFTNSGQGFSNGAANWAGEFGDVDGDGDLDIVVADRIQRTIVLLNDGDGNFSDSGQSLTFGMPGSTRRIFGLTLGDVDGDGDLDLWEANLSSGGNRLWINQNLEPNVSLSVDSTSIAEAGGTANVIATLSEAHTLPVTIDLAISGTATETDDFAISATQLVIAAGETAGSVTITAADDSIDEPDETVSVNIASITNAQGGGTVSVTIVDDDEPLMPDVTLSVDSGAIDEDGGVATFTATLSEATSVDVTVNLAASGTASAADYTLSATQIVIAAGATSGSVTVTGVNDADNEGDETVVLEIDSVVNGNEDGTQQATTTIVDDDAPPSFRVTSLTPTSTGFIVEFNNDLNRDVLNIYDSAAIGLGAADLSLTAASSGPVMGSLVIESRSVTFVRTDEPLAADTYTVTLVSGENAFSSGSDLLDGDGDGTGGDDYSNSFAVATPAAGTVTVSVPDFVRGPGQDADIPNTASGLPIVLSEGLGVRSVTVSIGYDPALLRITGAEVGADMPAGATVSLDTNTAGTAVVSFTSPVDLPAGEARIINLTAEVPSEDAAANYGARQVLDVHSVSVTDGTNTVPSIGNDGLHVVEFFADVSGNRRVNAADAAQVARIAALLDTGFGSSPATDPTIIGDVSGNGRINAADASLVAQVAALLPVDQVPPIPSGVFSSGGAAIPVLTRNAANEEVGGTTLQDITELGFAEFDFGTVVDADVNDAHRTDSVFEDNLHDELLADELVDQLTADVLAQSE